MMRRPPPIGLDACGRWTAAAQVSVHAGRARIDAAACVPRSHPAARSDAPDPSETARVADVLDRRGFRGRTIVAAAPDERLVAAAMELPARSSGAPVEQLAKMELARTNRRDPETLEVALWETPAAPSPAPATDASPYLAAALAHPDADAMIASYEAAGLRITAIEPRAWAMARACAPLMTNGPWALIDLGESAALLVVVRSGTVVLQRLLADAGLERLRAAITGPLAVNPEIAEFVLAGQAPAGDPGSRDQLTKVMDDYAQEIARDARPAIDYASSVGGGIEGVLLVGAGARVPGVAAALSEALGAPVRVATPADLADCPAGLADAVGDPRLTVAVGLSMRATAAGRAPDLVPTPRRRSRAVRTRARIWAGALAVWASALAGTYTWLSTRIPAAESWNEQLTRVENETRSLTNEASAARQALAREQAARDAADAVEAQPDWSMLFALLARAAGDEVYFESASLKPVPPAQGVAPPTAEPDRLLALDGMGHTQAAVSAFVLALEETGLFSRVSLLETRRKPLAHGEAIDFRVECVLAAEDRR